MRNVAILSNRIGDLALQNLSIGQLEMDGVSINVGIVPTASMNFDKNLPENRCKVLVRIKAFSCNYRDKTLIFATVKAGIVRSFYVIGSEFVGEVLETGPDVTGFQAGDRVIGNNHFTGSGMNPNGIPEGLPTNNASREYQAFHQDKLIKIPPNMPDEVAAAFSIGAQTSYSMIRKLQVTEGSNVLVTAAKSNTSLFAICALQKYGANVYAISTSQCFEKELQDIGVKDLVVVAPETKSLAQHSRIEEIVRKVGPFDYVIDPFFDLYLGKVIEIMSPGARYVTCGFQNQYQKIIGQEFQSNGHDLQHVMAFAMLKNAQIIGNCLGLTRDLEQALEDYAAGSFDIIVDSVFGDNQVVEFFNRTYNATDRFGKVVFQYD